MVDKAPDAFRTISEVAEDLDLPQHVLRFWETRFSQIRPLKRGGGRRYYRPDDIDLLRGIKHLLYGEGYTIKGVQRILKGQGLRFVQQIGRDPTGQTVIAPEPDGLDDDDFDAAEVAGEAVEDPVDAGPADPVAEPPPFVLEPPPEPVRPPQRVAPAQPARPVVPAQVVPAPVAAAPVEPAPPVPVPEPPLPAAAPIPARAALSRDDTRRLQAALFELMEARKLLDAMR